MNNKISINLTTIDEKLKRDSQSKILIFLSLIGPVLTTIFLFISIPLLIEFYSIPGFPERDYFSEGNFTILTNLMFLLFGFSLASIFGLMLSLYHKIKVIITLNILCILIGLGMFFPLLIALIGD